MTEVKLTAKQSEALALAKAGKTPAEVAQAMGISVTAAHGHLHTLREKGALPKKAAAKKTNGRRKTTPKATAMAAAVTERITTNGKLDTFKADAEIESAVREQARILKDTVTTMELSTRNHQTRRQEIAKEIAALTDEGERHAKAIEALALKRKSASEAIAVLAGKS